MKIQFRISVIAAIIIGICMIPATVAAEEQTTLAERIAAADSGDTITLTQDEVVPARINVSGKNFTLDLGGHTLSPGDEKTILDVEHCEITIKNGTITGAPKSSTYGAIHAGDASVTLENLEVYGNACSFCINTNGTNYTQTQRTVSVKSCTFKNNSRATLDLVAVDAKVENCHFEANDSPGSGSAIRYVASTYGGRKLEVSGCTFIKGIGNEVITVQHYNDSQATFEDCTVKDNHVKYQVINQSTPLSGGAGGNDKAKTVFRDCVISDNTSNYTVYGAYASQEWDGCTIENNTAKSMAGIAMHDAKGTLTLKDTVIRNNTSTDTMGYNTSVGGLYLNKGSLVFNSGAIYGNKVDKEGVFAQDICVSPDAGTITAIDADQMKDGNNDFAGYQYWDYNSAISDPSHITGKCSQVKMLKVSGEAPEQLYLAETGGTKYTTIEEAIEAAGEGDVVKIILQRGSAQMAELMTGRIDIAKAITIDLNGKKLGSTAGATGCVFNSVQGGSLRLIDSAEKKGSITSALWVSGGDVTLDANLGTARLYNKDDEGSKGGTYTLNALQTRIDYYAGRGEKPLVLGEEYKDVNFSKKVFYVIFGTQYLNWLNDSTSDIEDIVLVTGKGATANLAQYIKPYPTITNPKLSVVYDDGSVMLRQWREMIYLNGKTGDDGNSGLDAEHPVRTFDKARALLKQNPDFYGIKITGTVTVSSDETWTLAAERSNPQNQKKAKIYRDSACKDAMVRVTGGTFTLEDITIDGANVKANEAMIAVEGGGKILIDNGTLLTGGNSADSTANYITGPIGGAVKIQGQGASATMRGGQISNNSAVYGGGIGVTEKGHLIIEGGVISDNNSVQGARADKPAPAGGGIFLGRSSSAVMEGGAVKNNGSTYSGGGIALGSSGSYNATFDSGFEDVNTFTMNGGVISGNTATQCGGGLFVQVNGEATINKGDILNNRANGVGVQRGFYAGGGIYVNGLDSATRPELEKWLEQKEILEAISDGILLLNKAEITDNDASEGGGGLAACPSSNVIVEIKNGSAIYGNRCETAPDVYASISEPYYIDNVKSSRTLLQLSEYMLNGAPYNWKDDDGNPINSSTLAGARELRAHTERTAEDPDIIESVARCEVHIKGNTSGSRGGGIGINGSTYLGDTVNTKVEIPVQKIWQDEGRTETRPDRIRVRLLRNGVEVTAQTIKPDNEGNWGYTFRNQPAYPINENNEEDTEHPYEYTVEEDMTFEDAEGRKPGDYYSSQVEGDAKAGFIITNTRKPEEPTEPTTTTEPTEPTEPTTTTEPTEPMSSTEPATTTEPTVVILEEPTTTTRPTTTQPPTTPPMRTIEEPQLYVRQADDEEEATTTSAAAPSTTTQPPTTTNPPEPHTRTGDNGGMPLMAVLCIFSMLGIAVVVIGRRRHRSSGSRYDL